jgi:hypothetical protein
MIHFFCPACGIRLSVPRHLAGISGPCPSCGSRIESSPVDVWDAEPSPGRPAAGPAEALPMKPEPRFLPKRVSGIDVPAHPSTELPAAAEVPELRWRQASRVTDTIRRALIALLFVIASGVFVYAVLTFLKHQSAAPAPPQAAASAGVVATLPASGEGLADLPVTVLDSLEPVSPWKDAEAALEKFLEADTLAVRIPLMETRTLEDELAASCLAGPLPRVASMVPASRETDPLENRIDCYFTVEFEASERQSLLQTMLVRTRGGYPPRIVADAFLDTYGGRLGAYAADPTDKAGIFRAVVYAVPHCDDPGIPNREKKLSLKLLASDNTREIATAIFSRHSKIAEMLEDDHFNIRYGAARPCTVMLRWNAEEDARRPFLEVIAIRDLGWDS